MPKKYPPCRWEDIIKASLKLGYRKDRISTAGSHVSMKKDDPLHCFTVETEGEIKATGTRCNVIKALEKNNPGVDVRALIYGKKKARG